MKTNIVKLITISLLFTIVISCKKEIKDPIHSIESLEEKQIIDSIYLYSRQIYYWNENLPVYSEFNFNKYASGNSLSKYKSELSDIANYTINPETGKSFEFNINNPFSTKFSTIIDNKNQNHQASYILSDIGYNYGVTLVALEGNKIYIEYVIKNSPAQLSGLKRGMRVEKINGRQSENTEDFYKYIKAAFDNNSVELFISSEPSFLELDKYTIRRSSYIADPVNKVSIININDTKIGYISYLNFSSPGGVDKSLNNAFDYFNNENVHELIIDLRYNGGGSVSTCENFANLIIPEIANGKIMRKEKYNSIMQKNAASILSRQPILNNDGSPAIIINGRTATLADGDYSITGNTERFHKTRGLNNLKRVYFIVSKMTASASELLINCLKPYMLVKLVGVRTTENIGEPIKTFGKPIGFFPIKIKSYSLYLSLFQNLNANDEGSYFNGMSADITSEDDVEIDFGNPNEKGLKSTLMAMGYIQKPSIEKNILSKPESVRNIVIARKEILNPSFSHELIKEKIKLKKTN